MTVSRGSRTRSQHRSRSTINHKSPSTSSSLRSVLLVNVCLPRTRISFEFLLEFPSAIFRPSVREKKFWVPSHLLLSMFSFFPVFSFHYSVCNPTKSMAILITHVPLFFFLFNLIQSAPIFRENCLKRPSANYNENSKKNKPLETFLFFFSSFFSSSLSLLLALYWSTKPILCGGILGQRQLYK